MKFKNDIEAQADISVTGDANIGGAGQVNRKLKVHGNASIDGGLYITGASTAYSIEVGQSRSVDGVAYLDLTGEVAPDDYGLRMIRYSGLNAESKIIHTGTANLTINASNGADTVFTNTNVGIGQTSPGYKLDVSGDGRFTDSLQLSKSILTGSLTPTIYRSHAGISLTNDSSYQKVVAYGYNANNNPIFQVAAKPYSTNVTAAWDNDATTRLTVLGGGNVGIGTTDPKVLLHLRKDTTTAGSESIILLDNRQTGTSNYYSGGLWGAGFRDIANPGYLAGIDFLRTSQSGGLSSQGEMIFYTTTVANTLSTIRTSNERMRIDSIGNVGIGTDSPGEKLTINGNDNYVAVEHTNYKWGASNVIGGKLGVINANGAAILDMRRWTGTGSNHGTAAITQTNINGDWGLDFKVGAKTTNTVSTVSRMLIDQSGNVGIGTTDPKSKLHISSSNYTDTPTAGTTNGGLFISNASKTYGLNLGVQSTGKSWIQAQRADGTPTLYDLLLQPLGGNVSVGGNLILGSNSLVVGGTGSANSLDDYEEGTYNIKFTLLKVGSSIDYDSSSFTSWTNYSTYVKVGRKVTLFINLHYTNPTPTNWNNSSFFVGLGNLPFAAKFDTTSGMFGVGGTWSFNSRYQTNTSTNNAFVCMNGGYNNYGNYIALGGGIRQSYPNNAQYGLLATEFPDYAIYGNTSTKVKFSGTATYYTNS